MSEPARSRHAVRTAALAAALALAGASIGPATHAEDMTPTTATQPFVPRPLAPPESPRSQAPPASAATPPAGPAEDIRDIRGPKFIVPPWLLLAVVAGAVLLGLSAYGIWRWLRRRRRPRVLLPFEIALQRLEEMRALMQPSQAREFSIAVSDVVRRYIEERFGVTATHRTTEEFLHDLLESSHAPLARHPALLAEFLQQCDLVKFAGMSLTLHNMESLHHSARAFVLETAKPDATAAHGAPPPAPEAAHA
jgi:hypothetical protein